MSNQIISRSLDLSYKEYLNSKKKLTGCKIGNYIVYQKLGEGAFGAVFKGMNDKTKQLVAIKVLDLNAVEQQKSQYVKNIKRRLARTQAQMMKKCNSQNVVKCYQIFENKDLKLMVIQYCDGGDLSNQIQKNGHIPQQDAVRILKQVLNGLAELHSQGIVHRDLKTQNILVHSGTYKIADLGFSKQLKSNSSQNQLKGTKLGTVSTMAPEVIEGKSYGLQADIWSMGVIFYNMLFGNLPFRKISYGEILDQIKKKNIFQSKYNKQNIKISQQAKDFISKCLVQDSQKRLNWKNICQHKLFDNIQSGKLGATMRRDIVLNKMSMQILHKTVMQNKNYAQKDNSQSQKDYTKKDQKGHKVVALDKKELQTKQKQIHDSEKNSASYWAKEAFLQCLKTQLIFQEIIQPLQSCSQTFLQQRQIVELLYLLSARCFNNMSFKNHQLKVHKESIVNDLLKRIQNLYGNVKKKFQLYSQKLFKKQSEISEVVKDKFLNLFKKQSQHQKDRFLTGIESMDQKQKGLHSYVKKQQIIFTQNYLKRHIQAIMSENKLKKRSLNYIKNYSSICNITLAQMKTQYFKNYVTKKFDSE